MKNADADSGGTAAKVEDLFAYAERLGELPVSELIHEAKQVSGASEEVMLITVLARRLECYSLAEKLRGAMQMQCVRDAA